MADKEVAFSEIAEAMAKRNDGTRGESVDDYLNKQVTVSNVELVSGLDGEQLLIIHTSDGHKIRSGSKVLIKQAEHIKKKTDAGTVVKTTIIRKKSQSGGRSYYCFT
jgi:hypothetical protein